MNAIDPRPSDETIRVRILKKLKAHKAAQFQDEKGPGLFPSEITIDGLDEYNPYHRQAKTDALAALHRQGFVTMDQSGGRTVGFKITGRGDHHLSHGGKKEPGTSE